MPGVTSPRHRRFSDIAILSWRSGRAAKSGRGQSFLLLIIVIVGMVEQTISGTASFRISGKKRALAGRRLLSEPDVRATTAEGGCLVASCRGALLRQEPKVDIQIIVPQPGSGRSFIRSRKTAGEPSVAFPVTCIGGRAVRPRSAARVRGAVRAQQPPGATRCECAPRPAPRPAASATGEKLPPLIRRFAHECENSRIRAACQSIARSATTCREWCRTSLTRGFKIKPRDFG